MDNHSPKNAPPSGAPGMTPSDFAGWGLQDVAFVKKVVVDGQTGYAIHAADGTHMGMAPSRDLALAAVRQHELEPFSVH